MIDQTTVERLGKALAELHARYPEEDLGKIMDYALANRIMTGYADEMARNLASIALKLLLIDAAHQESLKPGGTLQ